MMRRLDLEGLEEVSFDVRGLGVEYLTDMRPVFVISDQF